jgi:glyoxylase-like metal-dependent hydrolase (beta-lactamase superfamily II)
VIVGPGGQFLVADAEEAVDGQRISAGDVDLTVIATPGPRSDHVAYVIGEGSAASAAGRDILVGDLLGGRAARAIVGPPDGEGWRGSLVRLAALEPRGLFPGHGEPIGAEALSRPPS